ncbi:hypothetical protein JNK13_08310 [bacterium]|nr:hypothetical protein [bacterium]
MKRLLVVLVAIFFANAAGQGIAQERKHYLPKISKEQFQLKQRLARGKKDGTLNQEEYEKAKAALEAIQTQKKAALADGIATPEERAELEKMVVNANQEMKTMRTN